jgi:predicted RNase H-like nuclease
MAIPNAVMPPDRPERLLVRGVDGCPAGWIAVTIAAEGLLAPCVTITRDFAELTEGVEKIAVDMPIGLPDHSANGGRGPERLVRPLIGGRQSSVFSVPSRRAVFCADYREACAAALDTSDPPRMVSKQAFNLFPKIREIDALLRERPELTNTVFEVHPEVAFWRIGGEAPLALPKKVKSRGHLPGLALRRDLLVAAGYPAAFLERAPRGAGPDDLLDAAVNALIARRIHAGIAQSFPDPPGRDAYGLPVAIWA